MFSGEVAWLRGYGRAISPALAGHDCEVVYYGGSKAVEVAGPIETLGRNALLVRGNVADAGARYFFGEVLEVNGGLLVD